MRSVNVHEATTHLSRRLEDAARGRVFVIAKAGQPKVISCSEGEPEIGRRLGFMGGEIAVPCEFDRMGAAEIAALFAGPDP
ncbi:MAG: type II toxin-antitoxin system prevent-host-death family antitoxin [Deltaproteobacteria bacterium]|nr:type II toxin-antitoxin system prevent-host-death family antitoxin [Deltaproteobacteria bacterium]